MLAWPVAESGPGRGRDPQADERSHEERRGPAGALKQRHQRIGGDDLADLAEKAGELGEQRHAPGREPDHDQTQDADERHRVAGPDEHAARHRKSDGVRGCEHELPDTHEQRPGGDQAPGTQPVEQHADGHLQTGVDGELQDAEQGQHGRRGPESTLGFDAGDAKRGALKDRDGICPDAEREDRPGPAGGARFAHRRCSTHACNCAQPERMLAPWMRVAPT